MSPLRGWKACICFPPRGSRPWLFSFAASRLVNRQTASWMGPSYSLYAARRAAFAWAEREGNDKMGGASCGWSIADGFAVLLSALRRRQP